MTILAEWVAGLAGWRRYLASFLLGALAALALPPFYLLPLLIVGFTGLLWLLDRPTGRWRRGATVWFFAWGHFILGLYWIGEAFFVDAEKFAALVPFPVLGLPAALALFPAIVIAFVPFERLKAPGQALALALAWTLSEWLRGHLFTGFPWNLLGYVWSFSDAMSQAFAYVGVYGMSLATVFAAALPALLGRKTGGSKAGGLAWLGATAAGLIVIALLGTLRLSGLAVGDVPGVRLRIVQGDSAQKGETTPAMRLARLERYLQLSELPGARGITTWIWPESAISFPIDYSRPALDRVEAMLAASPAPKDHPHLLLSGSFRVEGLGTPGVKVWDSLEVFGVSGILTHYDKRHLVPFGEYLPMRWLLSRIGLSKLTEGTIDFSRGTTPTVLDLPGLPRVRPLICYEDIFADEVVGKDGRPGWLVNVTNDAWFGRSSGPYQDFAAARARAIEQGVPLVRAANTGISAVIGPRGEVRDELGLGKSGVIDAPLPKALAKPPLYARFGDLVPLILALVAWTAFALAGQGRRREIPFPTSRAARDGKDDLI